MPKIEDKKLRVLIFPENMNQGQCVGVTIQEKEIPRLVELLRKECSIRYTTRRTFGPKKGNFITIQITRADR